MKQKLYYYYYYDDNFHRAYLQKFQHGAQEIITYMIWFEMQPVKYIEYADAKAIKNHYASKKDVKCSNGKTGVMCSVCLVCVRRLGTTV